MNFLFGFKKSQIAFFEFTLVFLLFGFIFTSNILIQNNDIEKDYKVTVDSMLNSIYYLEDFRNITLDEDLSQSLITQNWDNVETILNSSFNNFELIISNNTVSKKIFICSATYNKIYNEKIISIKNNTKFEFRKITLGVCY